MENPLSIPPAFDRHDLRSVFKCTHCEAYLGHRPVTTRCGHSFCQKCVVKGKCPVDACRHFTAKDCPHDIKLGRLLEEIEKVISTATSQGVWRKRMRTADMPSDDNSHVPPSLRPESDIFRRSSFLRYLPFHNRLFQSTPLINTRTGSGSGGPSNNSGGTANLKKEASEPENRTDSMEASRGDAVIDDLIPGALIDSMSDTSSATMTTSFTGSLDQDGASKNDLSNLLATKVLDGFNCDICCHCFLEPMTLRCGHTYCRECLNRCIDETSFRMDLPEYRVVKPTCPLCRQSLGSLLPLGEAMHHEYTWNWTPNRSLQKLINTCWVPQLEESKKHNSQMTKLVPEGMDIPLFVCTTSLPTQPTTLQIFEPKYRTMLRRVLRSPDKTFGMTVHDRHDPSRPFGSIGVLIQVESVRYVQPNATLSPPSDDVVMVVHTRGLHRFEVKNSQQYHGYWTVKIEPLYDLPDWESDQFLAANAEKVDMTDKNLSDVGFDPKKITFAWFLKAMSLNPDIAKSLKIEDIVTILNEFITKKKRMLRRDVWDHIISTHGSPPDNPSDLSWWLAGVFIRDNVLRMELLEMKSPKERLQCLLTTFGKALA